MIRPTVVGDTPSLIDLTHETGVFRPQEIIALRDVLRDYHLHEHARGHVAITVETAPEIGAVGRLAALLHDAPEYVVGDMISPFKAVLGDGYRGIEHRLLSAIHRRFGLPVDLPARVAGAIKNADRIAACHEATSIAGFGATEARTFFGQPKISADRLPLIPWPTAEAQKRTVNSVLWPGARVVLSGCPTLKPGSLAPFGCTLSMRRLAAPEL